MVYPLLRKGGHNMRIQDDITPQTLRCTTLLWPPIHSNGQPGRPSYFAAAVSIFFLLFFRRLFSASQIGCQPYFYT